MMKRNRMRERKRIKERKGMRERKNIRERKRIREGCNELCNHASNIDSKKFVVRFRFYWRPPEGFYFHCRGFKKCFL